MIPLYIYTHSYDEIYITFTANSNIFIYAICYFLLNKENYFVVSLLHNYFYYVFFVPSSISLGIDFTNVSETSSNNELTGTMITACPTMSMTSVSVGFISN